MNDKAEQATSQGSQRWQIRPLHVRQPAATDEGTCTARYLNAEWVEGYSIEKASDRIRTEETIAELASLVAEEIEALAGEINGRLKVVSAERSDVASRLENLFQALETKQLPIAALFPRILTQKARQYQLES